jgi:hypothetical protein
MRTGLAAMLAILVLLLSGCMGNAVTVSGQGVSSGTQRKTLDCGSTGTLAAGSQGTGKMTVSVTDGDGKTIFSDGDYGAGQSGHAQKLTGAPGTWTLKVSTGFGYAGQWGVTLTC